ncbi:unnamed protein product [Prorocentrum cordatum]|uniref:Uncharacterized protein n=1 Tax=Prorocentrum cordatum TaxID=2364126 RepID=A0ABN9W6B1_9DINO|nr:unnamed protein product [Polarella glacialis]
MGCARVMYCGIGFASKLGRGCRRLVGACWRGALFTRGVALSAYARFRKSLNVVVSFGLGCSRWLAKSIGAVLVPPWPHGAGQQLAVPMSAWLMYHTWLLRLFVALRYPLGRLLVRGALGLGQPSFPERIASAFTTCCVRGLVAVLGAPYATAPWS